MNDRGMILEMAVVEGNRLTGQRRGRCKLCRGRIIGYWPDMELATVGMVAHLESVHGARNVCRADA